MSSTIPDKQSFEEIGFLSQFAPLNHTVASPPGWMFVGTRQKPDGFIVDVYEYQLTGERKEFNLRKKE